MLYIQSNHKLFFFLVLYNPKTQLNIKHIAKTDFDKYSKGKCNQYIIFWLIFLAREYLRWMGDKWRQQRKLVRKNMLIDEFNLH